MEDNLDKKDGDISNDNNSQTIEQQLERSKQQVEGSKTEALAQKERADKADETILNMTVQRVENDEKYMKTLYEKDPKLADKVASNFEGFENADQFIKSRFSEEKPEKSLKDQVAEEVLAQLSQTTISKDINSKFSHLGEEQKKIAEEKFNVMKGDRNLTPEQATEMADMVTLFINKDQLMENAKVNKLNSYGNLSLGGVSHTSSNDKPSGLELGKMLGIQGVEKLYTN